MTAQYIHGPGIDEPLGYYNTTAWSYYQQDGLGSVTTMTNSSGSVTSTYGYDSFGNPGATVSGQPFRYTGREWDPETGLYYYRARYYDQTIGRFLGEDPIGFGGGVNQFIYVDNLPTIQTDSGGLCPDTCGVDVPRDSEVRKVLQTMMGETTRNYAVGHRQYGDEQSGRKVVGAPTGEVITEQTLDTEAFFIASTIINRANSHQKTWAEEVTRRRQYIGYKPSLSDLQSAMRSENGSDECIQLERVVNALNRAFKMPEPGLTSFKSVVQGAGRNRFVRKRMGAVRVAGTDFQY